MKPEELPRPLAEDNAAETTAAYYRYRDQLGWPVGCARKAVWVRLTTPWWALAVPESLACKMAVTAPAILFPGTPTYRVFVVHTATAPTSGLNEKTAATLRDRGIIELAQGTLLDLPPTEVARGPLFWTCAGFPQRPATQALTWTVPPNPAVPPTPASTIIIAITESLRTDRP